MSRKIITIITNIFGDRVVVGEKELNHAIEDHFAGIPQELVLNLLELVLKGPSDVYQDAQTKERIYNFFYRLEDNRKFIVAVIKTTPDGTFFASMYPTGKSARSAHKKFKKVKI